jgi:glycosyltransferase involved in cell wall biosynthesis
MSDIDTSVLDLLRRNDASPSWTRWSSYDAVAVDRADEALPVSVVIPAFNRADLIERAITSVLGQRPGAPTEVIVVDDASTDDTAHVARRLGAHVVQHSVNQGAAAARNTGIAAASQPWIAPLDSDDEWLPHCLYELWPLRGDHVLVSGASISYGEARSEIVEAGGVPRRRPMILRSPAALVYPHNFIAASGCIVRKDVVERVGGLRTDLRFAEDLDLWIRVLEIGTAIVSPSAVVRYHTHAGQKSRNIEYARHAQVAAISGRADRAWYSAAQLERRQALEAYDDLRGLARTRQLVAATKKAAFITRSPRRVWAVVAGVLWRCLQSRRRRVFARDGRPTVALMPGIGPPGDIVRGKHTRDLRNHSLVVALAALAREPAGAAIVPSEWVGRLVDRLGTDILAVTPTEDRSDAGHPSGGR